MRKLVCTGSCPIFAILQARHFTHGAFNFGELAIPVLLTARFSLACLETANKLTVKFNQPLRVWQGWFGAGVKIDFVRARGCQCERALEGGEVHVAGVTQAEGAVGESNAGGAEVRDGGAAEALENPREQRGWARFADEAGVGETVGAGDGKREAEDDRVQMEMHVAVPVSGRETERAESIELAFDFGAQRGVLPWAKGEAQAVQRG